MSGAVVIVVQDNGASAALSVPQPNIQLVVGCAVGGTVNQPFATTQPQSLQNQFIGGPLVEAGGLSCQNGAVVVAVSCPIVTKGTAYPVQASVPNGSSSPVTVQVDGTNGAWDTYYVLIEPTVAGTVGTSGIVVQVSLDAGRNFGPPQALPLSGVLVLGAPYSPPTVGGTGVQVTFGAGTVKLGDSWQFGTVAPQWNGAGVAAAIAAFQASQYGVAGVGSIHVVGDAMHGGSGTSDIATIQTQLQAGVAIFEYDRAIVSLRDALAPTAWGGSGETEAAWMVSLAAATSGLTAQPRICADGPYYNTPSPYGNSAGGSPAYRRPLAWSHAVRRTQIGLQRRAGRVKDGPYSTIAVNPTSDPADGFVYHDERVTPGLAAARVGSAQTFPKKGAGFFQSSPGPGMYGEPLLSAPGSQFVELPIGNVLDAACDIGYATGVEEVSDDLTTQANGTLDPVDLNTFQGDIQVALNEGMLQISPALASAATATVSPTANVGATGIIPVTISVRKKAYADQISETINLVNGGGST